MIKKIVVFLLLSSSAYAGDFQWTGVYRVEGYSISNPALDDTKKEKSYGLHHLVLRPRIEAADGLTIRSRFDIFNHDSLLNNQMGEYFGSGVGRANGANAPTSGDSSNAYAQNETSEDLVVTELYLTLVQEFGALVVGRTPLHFGLGVTHNAGKGAFDHWLDTRDLIGYKIVMGNLFFLPMYGKVSEGSDIGRSDDVTDIMLQLQYENPEQGTEMGIFYQGRSANESGNDLPESTAGAPVDDFLVGGAGATRSKVSTRTISLYGLKDTKDMRLGVEASWQEGDFGVKTSAGQEVEFTGYGIALEYEHRPQNSKFHFGLKAGYASGDDPETDDKFEGFIFDRNYDVAFLLFNHRLGQVGLLRTEMIGGGAAATPSLPDVEAISNATYFSPYLKYKWSEKWTLEARLTFGALQTSPIAGVDVDKSLGYELDLGFNFKPNDRVTWVNELGVLFPGAAFEGGSVNNFTTSTGYGLVSKAAISF